MADLGSISFTDVNQGTQTVDRTGEAQALVNIGNLGAKIANEAVKGKVTKEMTDAIGAVSEEVETSPDFVGPPEGTRSALGAPESDLESRIDKWKLVAEQGNTSQRTLAEMRVKEVLNEAQANFPWLHDDLARRAGVVLSGSAELHELGLEDAARRSAASRAQTKLDDIQGYATKEWKSDGTGGLGMSPTLQVGSPEWLAQYRYLDRLKQEQQAHARTIAMTTTRRDAAASEVADTAISALHGQFSLARASYQQSLSTHGFDAYYAEVQKGEGADLEIIRQFEQVGADQILTQIEQNKASVVELSESLLDPVLLGTADGQRYKSALNDFVAEQTAVANAFKDIVAGNPDSAELVQSLVTNRAAHVMRGTSEPYRNFMAVLTTPEGKGLIELAKLSHTSQGLILGERLGGEAVASLDQMFPNMMGPNSTPSEDAALLHVTSGSGNITPDMGFEEVINYLDKYQRDAENPYIVETTTDKQDEEAAVRAHDKHLKLWDTVLKLPEEASPDKAAMFLNGSTNSLLTYLGIGGSSPDVEPNVIKFLADPRLRQSLDLLGDNAEFINQRRAFGAVAKRYYVQTDPDERRADALHTFNTAQIGGVDLRDLVTVNVLDDDDGMFEYHLHPAGFKQAVDNLMGPQQAAFGLDAVDLGPVARPPSRVNIEEQVTNEIFKLMDPISNEVNDSINIDINLNNAQAPTASQRRRSNLFSQFYLEKGWLDGFNQEAR